VTLEQHTLKKQIKISKTRSKKMAIQALGIQMQPIVNPAIGNDKSVNSATTGNQSEVSIGNNLGPQNKATDLQAEGEKIKTDLNKSLSLDDNRIAQSPDRNSQLIARTYPGLSPDRVRKYNDSLPTRNPQVTELTPKQRTEINVRTEKYNQAIKNTFTPAEKKAVTTTYLDPSIPRNNTTGVARGTNMPNIGSGYKINALTLEQRQAYFKDLRQAPKRNMNLWVLITLEIM
jgi:hypothetical protein